MLPVFAITVLCIATWASALNDPLSDLPRFGTPLNNLTVSVGREAVFTCIVENLGPYKVAWLRVDTQTILTIATHVITKNHRIAVTHSGHRRWCLHIRDTKETDRGWYMCQVNTDPMSSNTGFLEVVVPPDILDDSTSTDMEVREGSNVTLRCAATGTPKPKVTWRREVGGTIAQSNSHEVGEGSVLKLTRVTRAHMGPYLCIASNGVPPAVSKRIVLNVYFQPMVWIENQLVGAYEGQTLVLECHSEAYPTAITYWTRPSNETITNGIDRSPTMRRPNTRRDSKKSWKMDHSHERNTTGMKDEPMPKGVENDDEQVDFQSATASSHFHCHLFANLGIAAITAILAGGLST
ncbi:lachesin-like isoform X3 [Bombus pascuorum]|uniref:lachesin-like isoform X3 n=1 Tax=Bombus pascuorum TaxID=65598 RepID=UPI00298EBE0D|nr:lachesin-like isoform X3 [Bombus pascuorum]